MQSKRVAVIGGGFTGTVFALKLAQARPDYSVSLIEAGAFAGRGVAYGACDPVHLLNVPVSRMEVGLKPSFAEWLSARPAFIRQALEESKGVLADAFVSRQLFGDYLEQQLAEALARRIGNIRRIAGQAVNMTRSPRQVIMADSGALAADVVVLATGNQSSSLPFAASASDRLIQDPWRRNALDRIRADDSLLLLGTGLTAVDMVIALRNRGHHGPIHAVSRHGLLPRAHHDGGSWPAFLHPPLSPRGVLQLIRENVRQAEEQGVPWQRVFDAARPFVASVWHNWSLERRSQFLRHLRTIWEVHRHRMAERIAAALDELLWRGILTITAGRVLAVEESPEHVTATIRPRGEEALAVEVDAVINCTGPASDIQKTHSVLLKNLARQGLVRSGPLGLALDSEDSAAIGGDGIPSRWLYALGSLTQSAWWEITAVPEINAQIDRLVRHFAHDSTSTFRPLTEAFLDIGAGI